MFVLLSPLGCCCWATPEHPLSAREPPAGCFPIASAIIADCTASYLVQWPSGPLCEKVEAETGRPTGMELLIGSTLSLLAVLRLKNGILASQGACLLLRVVDVGF